MAWKSTWFKFLLTIINMGSAKLLWPTQMGLFNVVAKNQKSMLLPLWRGINQEIRMLFILLKDPPNCCCCCCRCFYLFILFLGFGWEYGFPQIGLKLKTPTRCNICFPSISTFPMICTLNNHTIFLVKVETMWVQDPVSSSKSSWRFMTNSIHERK